MQHDILLMLKHFMTKSLSSSGIIFIASGGTIAYTEICTRKKGEQLIRIILYRLDLKRPTEDAVSYLFIRCLLLKRKEGYYIPL